MAPYVEGRIRLQKIGLLACREILADKNFFDDWRPDRFGGFSPGLASSLEKLQKHGYVRSYEAVMESGHRVNRYSSTRHGKERIKDFVQDRLLESKKIKTIVSVYFYCPLEKLLSDVCRRYPELTVNSKIKTDVNKASEGLGYPDFESDISDKPERIIPSHISAQQHVLGDGEFRKELAMSIGLKRAPDLDPESFERIQGIFADYIDAEHFDSEEMIREARGR